MQLYNLNTVRESGYGSWELSVTVTRNTTILFVIIILPEH